MEVCMIVTLFEAKCDIFYAKNDTKNQKQIFFQVKNVIAISLQPGSYRNSRFVQCKLSQICTQTLCSAKLTVTSLIFCQFYLLSDPIVQNDKEISAPAIKLFKYYPNSN